MWFQLVEQFPWPRDPRRLSGTGPSSAPAGTQEESRHVEGREHHDWGTRHPRVSSVTEVPPPGIGGSIGTAAQQHRNGGLRHFTEEFWETRRVL